MADQDPWEKPAGREPWEKPDPPADAPHDYTADAVNFGRGVAKGVGRYAVGAGQLAEDVFPGTAAGVRAIPGVSSAAHATKEFVMSPNQTWSESAGNLTGTVAPWAAGALTGVDETAGGAALLSRAAPYLSGRSVALTKPAQWLADLAARAGFGAAGGGLEATEKGDLASHARGAEIGGLTAGVASPSIVGPAARYGGGLGSIAAVETVARQFGVPAWYAAAAMGLPAFWHHAVWNTQLPKLAGRWASKAAGVVPSGVTGSEAGKTVGGHNSE